MTTTTYARLPVIHDTGVTKTRNNMDRVLIVKDGEHKLRLSVHLDSYDAQAYARAELWNGVGWSNVVQWAGTEHKLPSPYADMTGGTDKGIESALTDVLNVAQQIVR